MTDTNKKHIEKPIVAVDIDDVIAANAAGFVEFSNKKYGTHLTIDDYQEHWGEIWKTEYEETERRAIEYHASGHIATYDIIDGALDVLKKIKTTFFTCSANNKTGIN